MPVLPSCIIEPLWDQFAALLPERVDPHPLGCHRRRIPDRIVLTSSCASWSSAAATSASPTPPALTGPCAAAATSGLRLA